MYWNSIFNFIIVTFCMCLCANAAPLGNECSGRYSDADRQNHVEVKCAEINLMSYRVADYHYCCGCTAGQFVAEDCGCRNHYSTVCSTCPANSFTSSANVQKACSVSKPSSYCDSLQLTRYVEGNSTADARCECVDGSYALNSMINGCRKHSAACAKDFMISVRGNKTHDIQCQPCPAGYCTSGYEAAVKCSPLLCNRTTNASGGEVIPPDWPKPPDPTVKTPASTSAGPEIIPGPLTLAPQLGTPAWIGICIGLIILSTVGTIVVFRWLIQKQSPGTCLGRLLGLGHQSSSGKDYLLVDRDGTQDDVAREEDQLDNVDGPPDGDTRQDVETDAGTTDPGAAATPLPREGNGTPIPQGAGADGDSVSSGRGPSISDSGNNLPYNSNASSPSLSNGPQTPFLRDGHQRQQDDGSPRVLRIAESPQAQASADPPRTEESRMAGCARSIDAGTTITGSGTVDGSTKVFASVENSSQSNQDSPAARQESSGERDRSLGCKSEDQPQNVGSPGAAYIHEGPQIEDSADPCNTEEPPLKRPIRTEDRDTYDKFFREHGFAVRYEPTVGSYSLLAAIVMWLHSDLAEDQVTDHVTALLDRVTQYIRSHQAIFRLAILQNSRSVDEYLEEIKRGTLVCGKIMAEAIALSEGLTVKILSTDGWEFVSTEGPMEDAVNIGHVQDNYYLLLCELGRSRNADPEASSSTIPVSDSRLEARGLTMGQSYSDIQAASRRSAKDLGNGCGPVQGECAAGGSTVLSSLPPLPQHCECLEEGYHRKVRELINECPELESESSELVQGTELAIQMLEGSNSLPDKATPLANCSLADVKAFLKHSDMLQNWRVVSEDYESSWSPKDPNGLKDKLISLVINEQGSRLTVEKLIKSVRRHPSLYRLFCDNFIACLEMKCEKK